MKRKKEKQELQSAVNFNIEGEEDLNIPVLLQKVEPMKSLSIAASLSQEGYVLEIAKNRFWMK